MKTMSRNTKREYILRKSEDYLGEIDRSKKSRMLNEICSVVGLERKYVIKLLRGTRTYRPPKGRSKTYGKEAEGLLVDVWKGSGYLCSKYLKSQIVRLLDDLSALQNVRYEARMQVQTMSASTMDRILKNHPKTGLLWPRRNRRSGRNAVQAQIPCESGENIPANLVSPGDVQVDSVEFCGGDPKGDHYWAATATDRKTQWFEARPSFNLCQANYLPAFRGNLESFPFPIWRIHSDNGSEFMNAVILAYETGQWPQARISRSWPGRKNHNAHVEQKNGSPLRTYLGDFRVDHPECQRAFELLLDAIRTYANYCKPCRMLIRKQKRPDGKGYRCYYDDPKTPAERALESGCLSREQADRIRRKMNEINRIQLSELILKRRNRLHSLQKELSSASVAIGDSALRAAPSGTFPMATEAGLPVISKNPLSVSTHLTN